VTWSEWAAAQAEAIHGAGRWRAPRDLDGAGPHGTITATGQRVVSYASNDYLGLTQHPTVIAAAHAALDRWGTGSGAARLIVGSRPVHSELEAAIAEWRRAERAVLFPTGFAANLGVFEALASRDAFICSDELNHASIIDGTRLSRSETAIFPHRDLDALDALLGRARGRRAVVASDTVFSMDGDLADVDGLREVCARHGALLVLDEAHAVLGPQVDAGDDDIVRVGTLSKTLGALGGFVAGPQRFMDLIVNRARSYIFTTASSPADSAAALAAISVLRSPEGDALRTRLRSNIDTLWRDHPSPIVPIICGEERATLDAAACLLEQGMLVPAIRPPTVAAGTSRLRIALSAAHTSEEVAALAAALRGLGLA
jgi:8-amino-7-oxononanoate synthase